MLVWVFVLLQSYLLLGYSQKVRTRRGTTTRGQCPIEACPFQHASREILVTIFCQLKPHPPKKNAFSYFLQNYSTINFNFINPSRKEKRKRKKDIQNYRTEKQIYSLFANQFAACSWEQQIQEKKIDIWIREEETNFFSFCPRPRELVGHNTKPFDITGIASDISPTRLYLSLKNNL